MQRAFLYSFAVSVVFSASAATLTKDEQAVLDVLNTKVQVESFEVSFPNEIIVQAENFFHAEDITASQAQKVIENLQDIISVVKNNPKYIREEIDKRLNKIFKALDLSRSYDGKNVNIVNREGVIYFTDEPIIKATGQTPSVIMPIAFGLICGGVCFVALRKRVRG